MKFVVLIFALSICELANAVEFETECFSHQSPVPWSYCMHTTPSSESDRIIYHLHGGGGNELNWQEDSYYPAQIRAQWADMGQPIPHVASISFGPIWLLAEKNSSDASGLLQFFTDHIMKVVEANLDPGLHRTVVGESMGGFNTIQLAFKTRFFSKAAILCSPLADVSPFASESEITEFIEKSYAWAYYKDYDPSAVLDAVERMLELTKVFYPTAEDWEKANPLELARNAVLPPELYVSVGLYDRFVNYEGNRDFVSILKDAGNSVEWRPQWGGHCSIDIPSLARFLVRP